MSHVGDGAIDPIPVVVEGRELCPAGVRQTVVLARRPRIRFLPLVQYEWQESDVGPPRKYYRLTDTGRAQLVALDDYWNLINRTIADIGH